MITYGIGIEVAAEKILLADFVKTSADVVEFRHVPAEQGWPEVECDVLTMIDVLHHVSPQHQRDFMGRIGSSRTKKVIFKDIDPSARCKSKMNTLHDLVLSHQRPHYCRPETVAQWLAEMGFSVICTKRCDMLWYSHYVIVAER